MLKRLLSFFAAPPPEPVYPPVSMDEVRQMVTEINDQIATNYVYNSWTVMCAAFSPRETAILMEANRRGYLEISDHLDLTEYYRISVTDSAITAFGLTAGQPIQARLF